MKLEPYHEEEDNEISPALWRAALKQYMQAWDLYIEAGCPFGLTDRAMLIWFETDQATRLN